MAAVNNYYLKVGQLEKTIQGGNSQGDVKTGRGLGTGCHQVLCCAVLWASQPLHRGGGSSCHMSTARRQCFGAVLQPCSRAALT